MFVVLVEVLMAAAVELFAVDSEKGEGVVEHVTVINILIRFSY